MPAGDSIIQQPCNDPKVQEKTIKDKSIKSMIGKEDNWVHRAENMRCNSCMHFVKKQGSVNIGRCRKHAPTLNGWPVIFNTDWCGDHKLN